MVFISFGKSWLSPSRMSAVIWRRCGCVPVSIKPSSILLVITSLMSSWCTQSSRTCSTVSLPAPQLQRGLSTPGVLIFQRKLLSFVKLLRIRKIFFSVCGSVVDLYELALMTGCFWCRYLASGIRSHCLCQMLMDPSLIGCLASLRVIGDSSEFGSISAASVAPCFAHWSASSLPWSPACPAIQVRLVSIPLDLMMHSRSNMSLTSWLWLLPWVPEESVVNTDWQSVRMTNPSVVALSSDPAMV